MVTIGFRSRRFELGLAALVLLALVRYGWAVGISFINDDFLFLERARTSSFLDNWNFDDALGNVYRPLTRNLYFWIGLRLFGREPAAYHVLNLGLVALSLVLTALLTRRLIAEAAGLTRNPEQADGPALLAALLFGLHPAAGTPASWVCGVQDLLAVDLTLGAFIAHLAGRRILYVLLYAAAVLSKETAAFIFLLAAFWDLAVRGLGWRRACFKQIPAAALFAVWLVGNRWLPWNDLGSTIHSREAGQPSLLGRFDLGTVALTLRSLFLVEPAVAFRWPYGWLATAVQVILGAWVLYLAGLRPAPAPPRAQEKKRGGKRRALTALKGLGGLMAFAGLWCLSGILPLVTVISHFVYYAYYPALGLSVLLAALAWAFLTRRGAARRAALAGLALLVAAFLAGAGLVYHAATCDAQNIRRASAHLHNFQADLRRMHPSFPESSRVYFWNIPYWIGFQLADGPAMRVWYADPTLTGLFLSAYAPAPRRASFFFGYDDAMHLVEIVRGHPDPYLADPPPIYTLAHTDLGSTLAQAGEIDDALVEWRKVLEVNPNFADAAANLGMTLFRQGSLAEAVPVLERAVQLEPEAADVRRELGQAYHQIGAHAEALAALETYLRLAPAAPDRAQVEELIRSLRVELGAGGS